ncbi:MAG: DivIVA domain-containing protein [Oscillospiraceae bacterium]|jgi:DivIVA domain-containing protein|nr:DivIVA domain-containing protein [Oscillospiraceae bacterium]
MIEEKEFVIKDSGYDPDEVDEFLDEVADEIESLQRELDALRAELTAKPQATPAPHAPASATAPTYQEENIRAILINAQRICDESMADANARATEMVEKAKDEADGIVSDARAEAQSITDDMETLRAAAADYRARFQRLVDDQMHVLKAETELFKKSGAR